MKQALIVFVKKPKEGRVKTRLAIDIGNEKAVAIYKKLLRNTEQVIEPLLQDVFIYSDAFFEEFFSGYSWRLQTGDNLGLKMFNAFEEVFALGYDKVNIIGSDCFELDTAIIEESFTRKTSAVIGPSVDGGYYLLGLTKNSSVIFDEIDWSTDKVFTQTQRQLSHLSMEPAILPLLIDIDDIEDLRKFPELG